MFASESYILRITPRAVTIRSSSGVIAQRPLSDSAWAESWNGSTAISDTIRRAVEDSGKAIKRVQIHCSTPESAAEVFSIPAVGQAAHDAAMLALKESVRFDSSENPADCELVWTDEGAPPRSHMLAAAAPNEEIETLRSWARQAGLTPTGVTIDRASTLTAAIEDLSSISKSADTDSVLIRLEDQATIIAAVSEGKLQFIRAINIGADMLVDAATRALRASSPDATRNDAADTLSQLGVSFQSHAKEDGFDRATIAAIQPVLQRYTVELKQTLRFGLAKTSRASRKIHFTGPASQIPDLPQFLCESLELDSSETNPGADPTPRAKLDLLTSSQKAATAVLRCRAAIAVGVALCVAWIYTARNDAMRDLYEVQSQIQRISPRIERAERTRAATETARILEHRIIDAETRLAELTSARAAAGSILGDLASAATSRIRLTQIELSGDSFPIVRLEGVVMGAGSTSTNALKSYVTKLERVPTVSSINYGSVRTVQVDGRDARSFELTVRLEPLAATDFLDRSLNAATTGDDA